MTRNAILAPVLGAVLLGAAFAQEQKPAAPPSAKQQLAKALGRARVHNKRVLAVLVADGKDLATTLRRDKVLGRKLLYEFETVQFAGKDADAVAAGLEFPAALNEKPAMLVLDRDGKALSRLVAADVMADGALQSKALLGKFEPLFCKPADADKKLAAAMVEAKKTGRNIFIRFDAPW